MSNPQNNAQGGSQVINKKSAFWAQQVFLATINAADPAGLTDGNVSQLSMDQLGRLRVLATAAPGQPATGVIPGLLAQSVGATGRVVGPAANGVIATILSGSLPAGTYDVQVRCYLDTGAPAAADINNMEFRRGAAVISVIGVLPIITAYPNVVVFRMSMDGATALSINATGAATAGVGYTAQLAAGRIA